jgi:hypothetical protein
LQSESATTQETYNSIPRHDAEKHDPPMYAYGCLVSVPQMQGWLGLIAEAIACSRHSDDLAAVL